MLGARPEFELFTNDAPGRENLPPSLKLAHGVSPSEVDFGELGYCALAIESYAVFDRLQRDGVIPPEVRFQVSLPTPLANATAWMQFDPEFPALFALYTDALLTELKSLLDRTPHERLAIQWDVCFEPLMFEGWMPVPASIDRSAISDHLARISDAVPADVQLGYHFCFGDFGHVHMREPADTGRVVELISSFVDRVSRPINWMHIPVSIERDDDAYFKPLGRLNFQEDTEVYLGLIHYRDGVAGALRRTRAAQRFISTFGVATECGMGRRPRERGGAADTLPHLLALRAEVAAAIPPS